jgi:hypothetical protein
MGRLKYLCARWGPSWKVLADKFHFAIYRYATPTREEWVSVTLGVGLASFAVCEPFPAHKAFLYFLSVSFCQMDNKF